MNDEDLIGYLMDALDPAERAAAEARLRDNPAAAARLAVLRSTLAPLEADREAPAAPPGLAGRTLALVAAHLAAHEPSRAAPAGAEAIARSVSPELLATPAPARARRVPPRDEPELTSLGGRFRFDIVVAGCILVFGGGLVFSAIGKLREENRMVACQNTLRTVHVGLNGYADANGDRFPQVGVGSNATAETFAQTLAAHMPEGFRPCCPAVTPATNPGGAGYTYTLGYRAPGGGLLGFTRPDETSPERDLVPISADFPTATAAPTAGPTCPHRVGMNVLYVGGHVRLTTSPLVGPNGDDIFRNLFGDVAAGKDRRDIVLGRPGDRP